MAKNISAQKRKRMNVTRCIKKKFGTGTPVPKNATIVMEMFDHDPYPNPDDLMSKWTLKHEDIDGKEKTYVGKRKKNSITFVAEWAKPCKN